MDEVLIMKQRLSLLLFLLGLFSMQMTFSDNAKSVKLISVNTLKQLQSERAKFLLIDVREDDEWQAGHIDGAIHIPRGQLEQRIQSRAPQKDQKIVVYCRSGYRSELAAQTLKTMGYNNVYSLEGGIKAFTKQ